MVRSPSGVMKIRHWAVARPSLAFSVVKVTPAALMSWAKALPCVSSLTLPIKADVPPKDEIPTIVLAADPPEIIVVGPISA